MTKIPQDLRYNMLVVRLTQSMAVQINDIVTTAPAWQMRSTVWDKLA